MSWDQLIEPGLAIRRSTVESDRFGCLIDRVTVGPGVMRADEIISVIDSAVADVLILRYDAARLDLPGILARSRRTMLPAGALIYWEKSVDACQAQEESVLKVSAVTERNLEETALLVREVVKSSFKDYGNHYVANPMLDRSAALAGYEDWAIRSLRDDPRNVLVLARGDSPIGLATLEPGVDGTHVEILLAGLIPSAQGRGFYQALLQACERFAGSLGATRMIISTQVHNVRVQRAWARHGMRPFAAIETVHLVDRAKLATSSTELVKALRTIDQAIPSP